MATMVDRVGPYRIQYKEPNFASLVRSIVFQQLSGVVATAIFKRLTETAGGRLSPRSILDLTDEQLRAAGLSRQKSAYIRDLAEKAGKIRFARLGELPDEDVIERLTLVKGVGIWTAHMFLIFALRRPDVLPTGDLGIRNAIRKAYQLDHLPAHLDMERIAEPWRPYRSVASWYLWRSLELAPFNEETGV
jgi:DNA-3-methyladenine glycosylase II